eukprot:PhM_4_TR19017/c0_g1_i1/m.12951/K10405/KIFC1; kinesin family member C1
MSIADQVQKDLAGLKAFVPPPPPPHCASPEVMPGTPTSNNYPAHNGSNRTVHADPVAPNTAKGPSTSSSASSFGGNGPQRLVFTARASAENNNNTATFHQSSLKLTPSTGSQNDCHGGATASVASSSSFGAPATSKAPLNNGGTPSRTMRSMSPMVGSTKRSISRGHSPNSRATTSATVVRKPSNLGQSSSAAGAVARTKRNPSELELAKTEVEALRQQLREAQERAQEDAALVRSMEEERSDLDAQLSHAQTQITNLESDSRMKDEDLRRMALARDNAMKEVSMRDGQIAELTVKLANLKEENDLSQKNANARIAAITDAANQRMTEFESHISLLASREQDLTSELRRRDVEIEGLRRTLLEKEGEYRMILKQGEQRRVDLHNAIQNMKGNIRVYARVRPLIPHDREYRRTRQIEHYAFPDKVDHRLLQVSIPSAGKDYSFDFDKVFAPDSTQESVFEEISQLVQSALDGYKVCIFVYGQTGSGKTYTMEGGEDGESVGMIPRAVEHVFRHSQEKHTQGWTYTLRATFVEIYNETVHDLLNKQDYRGPGAAPAMKHEIRIVDNDTTITNVEEFVVNDATTVHQLLAISQANRKSESTLMNDRASRSHSVFTLKIHGVNEGTSQELEGVLNLIDLAGSERVGKSGVEGDRLRETTCINKSLTCLGDVIAALGKGDSHVPFRNSKLTHMLQPYMGGESKTLMFVNVSPAESHINESLCSLRFAAKVNACEIGLASRRIGSTPSFKR